MSIWNTSANAYNGAVGATAGLMNNNPMGMLNAANQWAAQATGQSLPGGDNTGLKNADGSINWFNLAQAAGTGGGGGGGGASMSAPNVRSGQLATTNMDPYMNPYMSAVLSGTLADLARQQSGVMNDIGAQASSAGAFGGSRHGLVEAEANRNYLDTVGQQSAQTRADAFNTAMQNAQFDISSKLQADMANQQAKIAAMNASRSSGGGGGNYTQMMLNAQLQREQMALGALTGQQDFNLNAAGQLADMSNLGFGMGNTINSNMMNAGAQQQAMYQNLFNSAAGQYGGWTGYPAQGLGYMNSALQGIPGQSSTTTSQKPGLLGSLTGAAQGIGVIGGMFCWVARAAYGADNPKWLKVRQWMLTKAPKWLFDAYVKHGPALAAWIERHPRSKPIFRAALGRLAGV